MATAQDEVMVTRGPHVAHGPDNRYGYRSFEIGGFRFERDEYFAHITCPKGSYVMSVDAFLRALMRDVAWGFFYGWVNFDEVFGTCNHYGSVEMYVGTYNGAYRKAGTDYREYFLSQPLFACFKAMLDDWVNEGYDPFAAPLETGSPYGSKHGSNPGAVNFQREVATRIVGLPGDAPLRTDAGGRGINRAFTDVAQDEPQVHVEPGFEGRLGGFNLFRYLSRSPVTWNPSICAVIRNSAYCPTTEEFILPVEHGNDRVEWFVQLSDEIEWTVKDKATAEPRARVIMKAGDVAAMPADIRHQGYSPRRSMLLVWENMTPGLEQRYASGELPPYPVEF